jgi:hypothetical protein
LALAAASPDTSNDERDARRLTALEQQVAPARVLWRPDSRDEFELALDEVMTALQLGNCDLVRCAARADGGVAARLCGPALPGAVHAKRTAASASAK